MSRQRAYWGKTDAVAWMLGLSFPVLIGARFHGWLAVVRHTLHCPSDVI